jgi:hypothetical protein
MKTFKLFAHREKSADYLLVSSDEFKKMTPEEKAIYFQIDEGTYPYLKSKMQKLVNYVGRIDNTL